MRRIIKDEELLCQVVDELLNLLVLPGVFALVVVDRVLRVLEATPLGSLVSR